LFPTLWGTRDAVDAEVVDHPATGRDAAIDHAARNSDIKRLKPGEDTVLTRCDCGKHRVRVSVRIPTINTLVHIRIKARGYDS
jgi:hypothetical protein